MENTGMREASFLDEKAMDKVIASQQKGVRYTTMTRKAGTQLVVYIYPQVKGSIHFLPGAKKGTSEAQKKLNEKHSKLEFDLKLHHNFGPKDLHLIESFMDEPKTYEEAAKLSAKTLRRIRDLRKKLGLPGLKWLRVIEKGEESGRWHAHYILDGVLSFDGMKSCFQEGWTSWEPLKAWREKGQANFIPLVNYLMKGSDTPAGKKKWSGSRNLAKPPMPSRNQSKHSKKKVNRMVKEPEAVKEIMEKGYPGYRVVGHEPARYNEYNGFWYLNIRMERVE